SYDLLLVYFDKKEGGRVTRIITRQPQGAQPTPPGQMAEALSEAWGRELRALGWPRRQELTVTDALLPALGWNDERTRVRRFWQEPEKGPARLYTEWQDVR